MRYRRVGLVLLLLFLGLVYFITMRDGYKNAKLANAFLRHYRGDKPTFWNSDNIAWAKIMRDNYKVIYGEFEAYEKKFEIPKYRFLSKEQANLDNKHHAAWRTVYLINYFAKSSFADEYFPKTLELLKVIPGMSTAFFSIADPWLKLAGHYGVYEGVMRYHLGLKVPDNASSCFITVGNERRHWEDGKDLIFDDNLWHWVENNTPQRRVVMFIDFLRDYDSPAINTINYLFTYFGSFNHKSLDILRKQGEFHDTHMRAGDAADAADEAPAEVVQEP